MHQQSPYVQGLESIRGVGTKTARVAGRRAEKARARLAAASVWLYVRNSGEVGLTRAFCRRYVLGLTG